MVQKYRRHPVKNFFIMGRIQWNHIIRVTFSVICAAFLTLISVGGVYYLKFKTGKFYFITNDMDAEPIRHTIWGIILPSILPTLLIAIIIGLAVAMYSSRKIALPLFKLRKWAEDLFAGNLKHVVFVRKTDDMEELATSCNQISRRYQQIFLQIHEMSTDDSKAAGDRLKEIQEYIKALKF